MLFIFSKTKNLKNVMSLKKIENKLEIIIIIEIQLNTTIVCFIFN